MFAPEDLRTERLCGVPHTALAPAANRPIAHHVLDMLQEAEVERVVAVMPHRLRGPIREALDSYHGNTRMPLECVEQAADESFLDVLGRLASAGERPAAIVHDANGLVGQPLGPLLAQLRTDATGALILLHAGAAEVDRLTERSRRALRVAELDPAETALGIAGACLLGPTAFDRLRSWAYRSEASSDGSLADLAAAAGCRLSTCLVSTWSHNSGRPSDLLELNRMALDALDLPVCTGRTGTDGNVIEGSVSIDSTAEIRNSVIVGPSVIGPFARVEDAFIGSYTSIGGSAHVQGMEIERSIICSGASLLNVGGRMVSSVVGRHARVFRDFSLPRAMRLVVGDGNEVALC